MQLSKPAAQQAVKGCSENIGAMSGVRFAIAVQSRWVDRIAG